MVEKAAVFLGSLSPAEGKVVPRTQREDGTRDAYLSFAFFGNALHPRHASVNRFARLGYGQEGMSIPGFWSMASTHSMSARSSDMMSLRTGKTEGKEQ